MCSLSQVTFQVPDLDKSRIVFVGGRRFTCVVSSGQGSQWAATHCLFFPVEQTQRPDNHYLLTLRIETTTVNVNRGMGRGVISQNDLIYRVTSIRSIRREGSGPSPRKLGFV